LACPTEIPFSYKNMTLISCEACNVSTVSDDGAQVKAAYSYACPNGKFPNYDNSMKNTTDSTDSDATDPVPDPNS